MKRSTFANEVSYMIIINTFKFTHLLTNTFIKIPFFIEGLLMRLFAGGFALLLTWLGYGKLVDVLMSADTTMWTAMGITGFIPFATLAIKVAVCYLLSGAVIGSVGTVISTRKYVKV